MESTESKEKKNICARVPMKLAVALATRLSTDQIDQTIFMEKAIHWYLGTHLRSAHFAVKMFGTSNPPPREGRCGAEATLRLLRT